MIPAANRIVQFESTDAAAAETTNGGESEKKKKKLRIIHFNDVYNIEQGSARFATAVDALNEEDNCLLVFSGDALSPSACKRSFFCLSLSKLMFHCVFV